MAAVESAVEVSEAAAKEKEVREARQTELMRALEEATRLREKEEVEFEESEARCRKIISTALSEASERARRALDEGAEEADKECRDRITKEIQEEEAVAVDKVLQQINVEHVLEGNSSAGSMFADMQRAKARKAPFPDNAAHAPYSRRRERLPSQLMLPTFPIPASGQGSLPS